MQSTLSTTYQNTALGREADAILQRCVHCGFCNATCPTYQMLGDELDGPRGRIYLIKNVLADGDIGRKTQQHLDRCLSCLACETTCPSGVEYGRLLDIGRHIVDEKVVRSFKEQVTRYTIRGIVPRPIILKPLVKLAQLIRPLLPAKIKRKVPRSQVNLVRPKTTHARKVLLLDGCAQRVMTPRTNAVTAHVLDRLGIEAIAPVAEHCCGAVSYHMTAQQMGENFVRRNIDAWWPYIEQGAEAIISTASGCGAFVKDYGKLMANDTVYVEKAVRISAMTKDIAEIIAQEDVALLDVKGERRRVALQLPCTLQHGQQIIGVIEKILTQVGYQLTQVPDAHLCCGSAGSYSLLQKDIAEQLLANKLTALQSDQPDVIATANIGCQLHLSAGGNLPVKHWIELLHEF